MLKKIYDLKIIGTGLAASEAAFAAAWAFFHIFW